MFFSGKSSILCLSQCCFYSCAGVPDSPLRRANVLEHISLLRRCFMPGKSPPCRILTLVAGNCKSFLFRAKRPRFPTETTAEAREGTRHAKCPKPADWGISGQVSGLRSPALRIEQSGIELPPHKKGINQAAKNHPPKSRMGHGMGQRRKTPETTEKRKCPKVVSRIIRKLVSRHWCE